jgi:hypothetical protein
VRSQAQARLDVLSSQVAQCQNIDAVQQILGEPVHTQSGGFTLTAEAIDWLCVNDPSAKFVFDDLTKINDLEFEKKYKQSKVDFLKLSFSKASRVGLAGRIRRTNWYISDGCEFMVDADANDCLVRQSGGLAFSIWDKSLGLPCFGSFVDPKSKYKPNPIIPISGAFGGAVGALIAYIVLGNDPNSFYFGVACGLGALIFGSIAIYLSNQKRTG